MFDLEQAIVEWRRTIQAAGVKIPAVLDELESHLRDETEEQMRSGSSAAEAFEIASQRIGPPSALSAEFQNARGLEPGKLRKWCAVAYGVELAVYTLLQGRQILGAAPAHDELFLGIAGLIATLAIAYGGWRLAPRIMKIISNQTARAFVASACCVLGILWLNVFAWFILPRFEFTPGQFAAAFLWAMLPLVTLPTLLSGIDQRENERVRVVPY
jgi:hypothetical protein